MNDIDKLGRPLPSRVAVFRALPGLGDMLTAVPALRALRTGLPEAEITLIGLGWAQGFFERFRHYLDSFLAFPGYPGLDEPLPAPGQVPAFLLHAQQQNLDLVLQLHGSGVITNPVAVLLGARRTAGYYIPGQYCPDPELFLPYSEQEPEVRRNLRLITFLGLSARGEQLEFPITAEDRQALAALPEAAGLRPGGYVCIHPGARAAERRWPPERFAAVADELARRGLRVVITGTEDEAPIAEAVAAAMRHEPLKLVGRMSLGAFAALLGDARLVVSNDTGASHLAAALDVPSAIVFTRSNPSRWAPLDRGRHRIIAPTGNGHSRAEGDIISVPVEAVLDEVEQLLKEPVPHAV